MRYKLFIFLSFMLLTGMICPEEAVYVKGTAYEGYIFPKEYYIIAQEVGRYTPTKEDIARVEEILKDSINSDYILQHQRQYEEPPINKKTLKKYKRQYMGYYTEDNEIVIWINLLKGVNIEELSKGIIMVNDGGSDFWSIYINLTTKELFNIQINGIS